MGRYITQETVNQSSQDQLNYLQILEQLAFLELAKQHLPADIIDIFECLGKVDNISFNQLCYIMENCMDQYYSKVIETFVATSHNIQNIQTSLNVQQMYFSTLCSHINNIYSKLSELLKHIHHHCMHLHQGDTVQIEAPEFDSDIDGDSPVSTDE